MARDPHAARGVIAAWMGESRLDKKLGIRRMEKNGWCGPDSTPWAKRIEEDINTFAEEEDSRNLLK